MSFLNPDFTSITKLGGTGINFKTVANTILYTVPSGNKCVPCFFVLKGTVVDGQTIGSTMNFGSNSTDYNNIKNAFSYDPVQNQCYILGTFADNAPLPVPTGTETVRVNVTVGATATTSSGIIDFFGYLY